MRCKLTSKHTDKIDDEAAIGATTRWMMKIGLAVGRKEAVIGRFGGAEIQVTGVG